MIAIDDEIRKLFLKTSYPKNVRISFPYAEHDDINNDQLISESLEFTENVCNQIPFKFGLCEASRLVFDTINVGNLKGMTIDVSIEIEYQGNIHAVPYGRFIIESHKRQAYYNGIRHAECYSLENLLESKNTFDDLFKDLLNNIKFKSKTTINLTAEDLVYLSFPSLIGNAQKYSQDSYGLNDGIPEVDGYKIKCWGRDNIFNFYPDDSHDYSYVYAIRQNYQYEYIKKVKELAKLIPKECYDLLNVYGVNQHVSTIYSGADSSYSYFATDDLNIIKNVDNILEPKNSISYGINVMRTSPSSTYWQSFISMSPVYYQVFCRVQLFKDDDLLYDTGFYDNTMTISRYDLNLFETKENSIFTVSSYSKTIKLERMNSSGDTSIVSATAYLLDTKKLFEINTYDYLQSYLELKGVFGKIDRITGALDEISLSNVGNTFPSNDLIPSDDLFTKSSIAEQYDTSMCINYLFDDTEKQKYKSIICKYKDTSGNDATYEYVIRDMTRKNKSGEPVYNIVDYIDYDISDNFIIQNRNWTDEQIHNMLVPIATVLENFTYTIGSAEAIGLPYIEAGDQIEVLTPDGGYITYIFSRTLRGIHSLRDTLTSE